MVEHSSSVSVSVNKAQLVGTHDGRIIVPVYDWVSFLERYFKKNTNIKKYRHFRFSKESPSVVFCKGFINSPEQSFVLLKNRAIAPPSSILPSIVYL